jgi:hypothetical protein
MSVYSLPSKIFESNLPKLLCDVARLDEAEDNLALDFARVEYWIPAAIVVMCSMVNRWKERGRGVSFNGHNDCPACGYLQRMDFFDRVGLELAENFKRRDPGTSFVEIQGVYAGPARLKDPLARKLAECLAGTQDENDDVLRLSEFALGEVIANCQQHADKPGYVTAQYVKAKDWARIGMADHGIGILESFRKAGSPHYRQGMSHAEALDLAMTPWVSSKRHLKQGPYGEAPNRGVGLKMIQHMLADTGGELFIASGDAWHHYRGPDWQQKGNLECGLSVPGTVVSIRFDRGQIDDYRQILAAAQTAMNLITEPNDDRFFE